MVRVTTPLGTNILIRVQEEDQVTEGGIHLPEKSRKKPGMGKVVSVGSGDRTIDGTSVPPEIQEGDVVYFKPGSGIKHEIDGDDNYLVLDERMVYLYER